MVLLWWIICGRGMVEWFGGGWMLLDHGRLCMLLVGP